MELLPVNSFISLQTIFLLILPPKLLQKFLFETYTCFKFRANLRSKASVQTSCIKLRFITLGPSTTSFILPPN